MADLSDLSIKVAHCSHVHNMWPFGSLVIILKWHYIIELFRLDDGYMFI